MFLKYNKIFLNYITKMKSYQPIQQVELVQPVQAIEINVERNPLLEQENIYDYKSFTACVFFITIFVVMILIAINLESPSTITINNNLNTTETRY